MREHIKIVEPQKETIHIIENRVQEADPTVPAHVKNITKEDIAKWNQGGDLSKYATKEYVDNMFKTGVTNVLEGEY